MIDTSKPLGGLTIAENLWTGRTEVPADILGQHFHRWPKADSGIVAPAPTYPFHTFRCFDYSPSHLTGGVHWRGLHVGPGDFSSGYAKRLWEELDYVLDLHATLGRSSSYCIWGTPGWCSSQPTQVDPYPGGGTGGSAAPRTQVPLREFITQLVRRYNTSLIRNNHGRKLLRYLEVWNEPNFLAGTKTFFVGSPAELAAMAATVRSAAKAVDPDIIVLSPSFSGQTAGPDGEMARFLNAPDGAGKFGRDHIDGLAFHPYAIDFPQAGYDPISSSNARWMDTRVRDNMVSGGLPRDFPIYGMEQGVGDHGSASTKRSAEWRARYVAGVTVMLAALGWRKVTWYSHDDELSGNPSVNPLASAAMAWCAQLGGKTLLSIDRDVYGAVVVSTTTGEMVF